MEYYFVVSKLAGEISEQVNCAQCSVLQILHYGLRNKSPEDAYYGQYITVTMLSLSVERFLLCLCLFLR